ncbi:helix-turn-helix domain-containing protein [[Clostridium] innocuum]|uniref:helix-turn-helix domain-containing protein n=1 Tax=Clostridium innocuum TaxID=1522 RepID=UPI001F57A2BE|nr:helix-turn-helix domain-containing protein [[Clostridium] innocuum]MCI3002018.1 helix-turn-helix domain-containing protein [[Clostridium] innocuum]MCR0180076.1 helix-turn-helix domain-containing protein [[Clostridium] innocuum]MCR0211065.1 helix-turn-helix domain-containing protein [[Clostridium] innocuum]MCR0255472.1 helix-turn-helix domain-containing protein [[Clostridium] innocuum]MCR0424224.1 helix-turn-helix domain-containing protein [[Clostridium] innocuum]
MGANNRVKELRKMLNLSQESFGENLGIQKASISRIEKGVNGLTTQLAKLISKTYNVNYLWLTEGKGEMFEAPGSALDDLAMQYDLNEIDLYLIKTYLDMPKDERAEFSEAILNKLLTILKKELHTDQKN